MYYKCWGCNQYSLSIFGKISGSKVCYLCKKSKSSVVSENYDSNLKLYDSILKYKKSKFLIVNKSFSEVTKVMIGWMIVIIFWLGVLWIFFGGLIEDQGLYKSQNTITIDCGEKSSFYSMYCNGDFQSQMQVQDAFESNYFQNIVR